MCIILLNMYKLIIGYIYDIFKYIYVIMIFAWIYMQLWSFGVIYMQFLEK